MNKFLMLALLSGVITLSACGKKPEPSVAPAPATVANTEAASVNTPPVTPATLANPVPTTAPAVAMPAEALAPKPAAPAGGGSAPELSAADIARIQASERK